MMSDLEPFEWDSKNYTHHHEVHSDTEFPLLTHLIHNHNLTFITHCLDHLLTAKCSSICMVTNVSREWRKSQYRTSGQQWTNLMHLCNKWEMRDWKLPSAVVQSEVTSREISGLNMLLPVIYTSKCCLNLPLSLVTMKVSNPYSSTSFSSSRQTFNIKRFLYFIC